MPKDEADPEDPMELVGVFLPGDERKMAECFVEEFLLLGFSNEQVLQLFRDPFYEGMHRVYERHGEGFVRELIAEVGGPWQA